jgi:hypothetical protein
MWRCLTEPLDRWAIKMACSSVVTKSGGHHEHEAEQLLAQPDFFPEIIHLPGDLAFSDHRHFSFTSPIASRWMPNNTVHGRLFRTAAEWQSRPAVILLHGWNSERAYETQFPFLGWRFNRHGVNAAMIELPFHGRRRPREREAINDFISHDLLSMVEATQQALADTQALVRWLLNQGCPAVGVWGISLGAWLAGLLLCTGSTISFGTLMTPVPNVELAIRELDFCAPIRQALEAHTVDVTKLNLASLRLRVRADRVLIVEGEHDIFAPAEVVEELWNAWGKPNIWRVAHGHISILASLPILERTVRWLAREAKSDAPHRAAQLASVPNSVS